MKKHARLLGLFCVLLAFMFVPVSSFAAAAPGIDTSEFVKLQIYLIGAPAPDYDKMLVVLNEKLKADINAEVEVFWMGWGEYAQAYPLLLASGEPIDAIYASTWTSFYQEAAKGAFMPIEDLAPIYMPRTFAEWDENYIKQITVGGHIVGIPTLFYSYGLMAYIIRGDIAEEVGFDREIKCMDDFGEYLRLVSEKRPDLMSGDWTANSDDLLGALTRENGYLLFPSSPAIVMDAREGKMTCIYDCEFTLPFFKKMKEWSDAGYWSKSVLSDMSQGNFAEGRAASRLHNTDTWKNTYIAHPDWNPLYYPTAPYSLRTRAMQDGFAIPASSKNPERALMMLELFFQERDYWELLAYGIKGEHYEINPDGTLNPLNTEAWAPGGYCDWAFQRVEWKYPVVGEPPNYREWLGKLEAMGMNNPMALLNVNFEPIKNERAAVIDVCTQYSKPLVYGYVDDVEAGYETLMKKLDEAGLRVMMAEMQRQYDEFLAAQ